MLREHSNLTISYNPKINKGFPKTGTYIESGVFLFTRISLCVEVLKFGASSFVATVSARQIA